MVRLRNSNSKRGVALIEFAISLPLLVLLTFGAIEYGWMFLKMQEVTNAARAGSRLAVLPDTTSAEVNTSVGTYLAAAGMGAVAYAITTTPAEVSAAIPGEVVTVTVAVPYGEVDILGMSIFPTPANLTAAVSMAKEGP